MHKTQPGPTLSKKYQQYDTLKDLNNNILCFEKVK